MAIQLAPLVGAGLGALQQSKIQKAQEGTKTYTKPKTIFGKLIGGVSGRTAAAEATEMNKSEAVSQKVLGAMAPSAKSSTPITGGFSFGGEASRKTYLPFVIVGGLVAIFYFMRGRKGGRRRR
jgi:uncharacterized MAPEG superfamily protein